MTTAGYDISASTSTSSSAATGATKFAPVSIVNLGTGGNAIWIALAAFAAWWLFFRKK